MKLKQLATPSNLELAWRRITTGGNYQYKRYFRPLYRVQDKARLRYVLYRAEPDPEVLKLVCRLVPHHPEHADAFFAYPSGAGPKRQIRGVRRPASRG